MNPKVNSPVIKLGYFDSYENLIQFYRFYRHIIKMSLEEEEKIILQSNQGSNKFLSKVS